MDNFNFNQPNQSPALSPEVLQALVQSLQGQGQPAPQAQAPQNDPTQSGAMDPEAAHHAIGALMFGNPGQSNLVGVRPQIPGNGIGSFFSKLITGHPLMHSGDPVMGTTQIANQSQLAPSMQLQPIGTDASSKPIYDYAAAQKQQGYESQLAAAMAKLGATKPAFSPELASAIQTGDQDTVNKQWKLENPDGKALPQSLVAATNAAAKTGASQQMAGARDTMNAISSLKTLLQYGGPGAAQKAASDSQMRVVNIQRAQQLAAQIEANGGVADQRQRAEFATAVSRSLNPTGVLTNEALNLYLPDSAKGKFGNFVEYLTNEREPVNFTGFLPQMQDLLSREMNVNTGVINQARQMGLGALNQLPIGQKTINNVINSPIPGSTPAQAPSQQPGQAAAGAATASNPQDWSAETDYLKKAGARLTPANLKWARNMMKKNGGH